VIKLWIHLSIHECYPPNGVIGTLEIDKGHKHFFLFLSREPLISWLCVTVWGLVEHACEVCLCQ
jgi:hypothetical protein